MGFLSLLKVASMPVVQMLLISILGAFMATDYLNLLSADTRSSLNKIVFSSFTPSLVFASLAKTVNFQDIISMWFMTVNIGLTFFFGWAFGWIAIKLLRPEPSLEGPILAMCSAGNLGNILLIIIPGICNEDGNPFGDKSLCSSLGLSYVSFSMAIGTCYIWTIAFHLIRSSSEKYEAMVLVAEETSKQPNKDLEAHDKSPLLAGLQSSSLQNNAINNNSNMKNSIDSNGDGAIWKQIWGSLHNLWEQLTTPPVIASILGLIFGAVTWFNNLLFGNDAPLKVINDSIQLLGEGTIPCITLILGGNLTEGLRNSRVKPVIIIAVICVKYIILPPIGIAVVKGASYMGFLPSEPLYQFVLMIQFALPPAMNIGTMTQLLNVAQEECSVLFLWTYLAAAFALTGWSTIFMWLLS